MLYLVYMVLALSVAIFPISLLTLYYMVSWAADPGGDTSIRKDRRRKGIVLGRIFFLHMDKSDLERQKAGFDGARPVWRFLVEEETRPFSL